MINKVKLIWNNQTFRKYFFNTGWLFGYRIISMFVSLFVGVWAARYLGPEQFGLLSYVQAFVGLFVVFSNLGLDGIVVRELVKNEEQADTILGTAFFLKLSGAVLLLILTIGTALILNEPRFNIFLMLLLALSSIFQSLNVIDFYFQSKVISKFTVYANFVVLLLSSIIKILLILTKQPLLFFVLMFLIDAIILSLGLFIFYQKQERNLLNWKFKIPIAKELLSDSWPSILAGLMITIYMKIDQVMIKEMLSETQVGLYSAAVRISEAWYFIPMAITSSIAPNITSSKLTNEELYKSRLKQLYRIMFIISIGISIIITFTADFIILNLYGTDYILSAEVLLIHIWASVFVFIGVANSQWLLNENLLIFGTINTSIGAFANMGLNLLLIPIIGINGAAWATLISYMLSAYFCLLLFNKTRPSFFHISSSVYKWL